MATYKLTVNGQPREVAVDPSTPLLWVLREELNMTGTKYGCGVSACGACTVHVDGVATRSCMLPMSLLGNRPVVTIEAMASDPVGRVVLHGGTYKEEALLGEVRFMRATTSRSPALRGTKAAPPVFG